MDEQVFTVAVADGISVVCRRRIAFQPHKIGVVHIEIHHFRLHIEKFSRKIGVYFRVNPPLAHVDVKFLVRYRFGYGFLQRPHGCLRPVLFQIVETGNERHGILVFGDHISGQELSLVFPTSGYGIVENLPFEGFRDLRPILACGLYDVVHIHLAVEIEAACQCFDRGQPYTGIYFLERHRLAHDVGLEDTFADLHFNGIDLHAQAVLHDKIFIVVLVEEAPFGHESIIQGIQPLTQSRLLLFFLPLFR